MGFLKTFRQPLLLRKESTKCFKHLPGLYTCSYYRLDPRTHPSLLSCVAIALFKA